MTQPSPIVQLSEILRERTETPAADGIIAGHVKILAKIGFGDGRIQLRNSAVTNTEMILVHPGDLVISGINAAKGAIALHTEPDEPIAATIHYSSYSVDRSRVEPQYLWWYLRSDSFRRLLLNALPGGIKTEVKPRRFLAVEIPLPSVVRQKEIIGKLGEIAEHVAQVRRLSAGAGTLISSAMSSFLTDVFSSAGPLGRLEDVILMKPRSGPAFVTSPDWEGTPVLMPSAVTGFGVDISKVEFGMGSETISEKDRLEPGDLLIARGNKRDQVGNAGVVPEHARGWVCANLLMRMKVNPRHADPHFCIYWLRSPMMRQCIYRAMKGTNPNIQKINQQSILAFPFPTSLPPEQQRRIVAYLDRLQTQVDGMARLDAQAGNCSGQLLQRVVTQAFSRL